MRLLAWIARSALFGILVALVMTLLGLVWLTHWLVRVFP